MSKTNDAAKIIKEAFKNCKVNSYEGSIQPSIGYFFAENAEGQRVPVEIDTTTVKGTISNKMDETKLEKETKKLNADKANIQTIDVALLPEGYETLVISFSVKVVPNSLTPYSNENPDFRNAQTEFSAFMKEQGAYTELAKLYVQNLLNLRWMWANRLGINPTVTIKSVEDDFTLTTAVQNNLDHDYTSTEGYSELITLFANALSGQSPCLFLNIEGKATMESGSPVKPSQEMPMGKEDRSRVLYSVKTTHSPKHAAFHTQKIGNAIRTIDHWYTDYETRGITLPVEPYGVSSSDQFAYRKTNTKTDFYSLISNLGTVNESLKSGTSYAEIDQSLYMLAVYVRGGVFS